MTKGWKRILMDVLEQLTHANDDYDRMSNYNFVYSTSQSIHYQQKTDAMH